MTFFDLLWKGFIDSKAHPTYKAIFLRLVRASVGTNIGPSQPPSKCLKKMKRDYEIYSLLSLVLCISTE